MVTRDGRDAFAVVSVKDLIALEEVTQNREEFLENRHQAKMREFRALKAGVR